MIHFVGKVSAVALAVLVGVGVMGMPASATDGVSVEGTGALAVNLQYKVYGQMTAECAEGEAPEMCRMVVRPEMKNKVVRLDLADDQNVEVAAVAATLASELALENYRWTRGGTEITSLSKADFNETCEVEGVETSCANLLAVEVRERAQGGSYYTVRLKYNMSNNVSEDEPEYLWQKDGFSGYELPILSQEGYTFLGWHMQNAEGAWKKVEKIEASDFGAFDELAVQALWVGLMPGEDGNMQMLFDARGGEAPAIEPGMGAATDATTEETSVDVHAPDTGEVGTGEAGARSSHAVLYGAIALGIIVGVGIVIARMRGSRQIGF